MWQNNFFLAWIDWSHAFDFRMFCKNINCFRLWWKIYLKHCTWQLVRPVQFQGRCVVWIIGWTLQIHCNPRVPLGANQLVSKGGMETDDTVLQKIYLIWYSFCTMGKSFARLFEVKNKQIKDLLSHLIFASFSHQ